MAMKKYNSVEDYFADQTGIHLEILNKIKDLILEEAPRAKSAISYGMPSYTLGKVIAGMYSYKNHVSFYPFEGTLVEKYQDQLEGYKCLKGTIQLDIKKEFPEEIIRQIVKDKLKMINA
ncbi:iron chaperone [Portibacter lacus]|uniref:YdhG-like domain-containing protein n=1 Tax=Portibacter lacus TaxID=1099794 RepID=A0AA37SN37_9BACT|nr:DUF1801 domain-containing protein [Portibacter lacus]GLR17626.1 hypothetical protein GCM10007940_22410 [Portibacter lacus]